MRAKATGAEFKKFKIPDAFFEKLYEFTGVDESSRGFVLAYVDQSGAPVICTKTANSIVEMGLRKALDTFLVSSENNEESVDIGETGA